MKFVDFIKPHRHKVLTPEEEVHDIEFCMDDKDNLAYKIDDDPEIKPIGSAVGDETIVGDIRPFAGAESDIPDGWLPCFGQNLPIDNYRDLYEVIEDTYNDDTTETGYFRLPDLRNRFIEGSSVVDGTPVEAGLPNITGSARLGSAVYLTTKEGVFEDSSSASSAVAGTNTYTGNGVTTVSFDASKSNDIYGNSDTVQPPSLKMIYIIRWKKANVSNPEYAEDVVVGDIRSFAGTSEKVPTYWHICDGTELSQDEYPELFAVIGTKYNTDTTPTGKFALPNLINKFVEGSGDANVGEDISAGLPNIHGMLPLSDRGTQYRNRVNNFTSAIHVTYPDTGLGHSPYYTRTHSGYPPAEGSDGTDWEFNAGWFNSIYSDSVDTVQPPAVKMLYIIRLKPSAINTTSEEVIIGDIRAFATINLPSTWIVCRGQNVKQSAYPELFAVIGTMYNNSSTASDEFGIPDLTGRFIQGALAPDGTPVAAGLPNLKGDFNNVSKGDTATVDCEHTRRTGTFSTKGVTPASLCRYATGESISPYSGFMTFDASKGQVKVDNENPASITYATGDEVVYGKSTTVQPPAYKMVYAIRAKATNVDCILQPLPMGHDGDMLVFDGVSSTWKAFAPVDITAECTFSSSAMRNQVIATKVGKMIYITGRNNGSVADKSTITLPANCKALSTGCCGAGAHGSDWFSILSTAGSNVLTTSNINNTGGWHVILAIQ